MGVRKNIPLQIELLLWKKFISYAIAEHRVCSLIIPSIRGFVFRLILTIKEKNK